MWRRRRPLWLPVALSVVTFGIYPFYWLYATWRELQAEESDSEKHPVWHALAIAFVPIYSYFRFHAHMREVKELAEGANVPTTLNPGWAVVVWIITSLVDNLTFRLFLRNIDTPIWLDLLTSAIDGGIIAWAQASLNDAWSALPGGAPEFRIHPVEVFLLVIGGLLTALVVAVSI
jgi:hypothetical protein